MASITVRKLDDDVKRRLRLRAAEHGRSLEAEVREILNQSAHVSQPSPAKTGLDLFNDIRAVVDKFGGFELEIPKRTPMRNIDFGEEETTFRGSSSKQIKPRRRRK